MNCIEVTSVLGCWFKADNTKETIAIVREYRKTDSGEILLYKTRYSLADGTLITPGVGDVVTPGQCAVAVEPLSAPGALLAANACVGTPILVPPGNFDDVRTVGTGGTYATLAAAMADVTVVDGTILEFVSDVVDTVSVTLSRAVVVDLAGFTHSNATSVNQISITVPLVVIKNGTIHHTKVTNTSLETAISTNVTAPGPVFIVSNTIKVQEFGILVRGAAMIEGNHFEYAGASATNSHRFISLFTISGETRIHNNTFLASNRSGTTRYSNFVFIATTTGAVWNAPLFVSNNVQTGGDLRQFVFNETLVPTAGSKLIVTGNTFNDFNGGVGLFGASLYNGLDEILIADNVQGGDSAGNFKGLFFVDGSSGTLDADTVLQYGGNTTAGGTLRVDYTSMASDSDNVVARRAVLVQAGDPVQAVTIPDALQEAGLLLQDLKARRTYIVDGAGNPLPGFGTQDAPYVVTVPEPEITYNTAQPTGEAAMGALWYVTTNPAAPSEENVTEHWVYALPIGWTQVWKKEYMFLIQLTDTFDAEDYYYYGGDVGPNWQIHRYLHVNPTDPLYMIPEIAQQSNNSGYTTLTAAWADRTTLTYA